MPLIDYLDYRARIEAPAQLLQFTKNTFIGVGTGWSSLWIGNQWFAGRGVESGATPTASVALDRTAGGAITQRNPAVANNLRVWLRSLSGGTGLDSMSLMIADRLNHSAGLNAMFAGAQTTNLPTAALTRYTSGAGVFAGVEVYSAIGSGTTTMTISYTNDAGTSGRTSPAVEIGGTTRSAAQKFFPMPLMQGDNGVRSVQSFSLGLSTGVMGNVGITLYRPLAVIPCRTFADYQTSGDPLRQMGFLLPQVQDDACLFFIAMRTGQVSTMVSGEIAFMEA